jgi:uncharacterized protein YpuA (DUF1002 family)
MFGDYLTCSADACSVVTIGADLSDVQKERIFEFFNVNELDVQVVEITNKDEREYLTGLVEDSVIGTHTYSCTYIKPTTEGGVFVKTANLNWVTAEMLGNALITAGIENCQVIATAPFEVSGTGALTGVLAAYETATEETLDSDKKELATNEVVISADIIANAEIDTSDSEEPNTIINQFITDVKTDIINTDDSVEDIIKRNALKYGIQLTEEQFAKLQDWGTKLSSMDYGDEMIKSLGVLNDNIKELAGSIKTSIADNLMDKSAEGAKNWFQKVWEAIVNFFKSLFDSDEESYDNVGEEASEGDNIFENVNQDVFQFDDIPAEDKSDKSNLTDKGYDVNEEIYTNNDNTFSDNGEDVSTFDNYLENSDESIEYYTFEDVVEVSVDEDVDSNSDIVEIPDNEAIYSVEVYTPSN